MTDPHIDVELTEGGLTMRIVADGETKSRAWVALRQVGDRDWALTGIDTQAEFERRGYGRRLVEMVRCWAGQHGHTVRTDGAMPDVYGFHKATGCRWIAEDEEFVVAPVGQHEAPALSSRVRRE